MKGMVAVWIPGKDHAGIATLTIVQVKKGEKELRKKEKHKDSLSLSFTEEI